ncbi:MAG: 16S rRNA (cytosine(1402)-N(4))-methyltransferase RsmH [Pseudomonadota bacterium]
MSRRDDQLPTEAPEHITVMGPEAVEVLAPRDGGLYVDGTFGLGGTTALLLAAACCRVVGIDRDHEAIDRGQGLATRYAARLSLVHGRFSEMDRLVTQETHDPVDGITLDLGVSSPQLDQPERGFSWRHDAALDMRMDAQSGGQTAADLVNQLPEAELAQLIWRHGDERRARQVARAIATVRADKPITRTTELAEIVRKVVRRSPDGIDPCTRTFQALRVAVNEEDQELDRGLAAAERLLAPGGRLAVIAFQSHEDRAVKRFLHQRGGVGGQGSRHRPARAETRSPSFRLLGRGARRPSDSEVRSNPRARSARLRAAERTAAAPWPQDETGGHR